MLCFCKGCIFNIKSVLPVNIPYYVLYSYEVTTIKKVLGEKSSQILLHFLNLEVEINRFNSI